MKHLDRYESTGCGFSTKSSKQGLIFCHPSKGKVLDLTDAGFRILMACVDTFRQIFRGRMNPDFLVDVNHSIDLKEKQFQFFGYDWLVGKSSKQSGYQYRLQNNELGVILLFKMFHAKADSENSHLKIECSPWFLDTRKPAEVDDFLLMLAKRVLVTAERNYPAIHLAVDFQGWIPDNNLPESMTCRYKRISQYNGIDRAEFNFSEVSCIYDRSQSFKFGPATSMQLAIYNKSVQAKAIDKLDYMEQKWCRYTDASDKPYDPDREVFRVELRFHHSVIKQFALGSFQSTGEIGFTGRSFADLEQHMQGLWEYGLRSFKLCHSEHYYHPIWSVLHHDVSFSFDEQGFSYQRYYKKPDSFSGKNYQLLLGNYLSSCARNSADFDEMLRELQGMMIWNDITLYYESTGVTEHQLIDRLRESYQQRILSGYSI